MVADLSRLRLSHVRRRGLSVILVVTAIFLGCGALTGCASAGVTKLPNGITIDVYQSRIDYSEHKLEVAVSNRTDHPFTVTALSFSAPQFAPEVQYERSPTTIRPQLTTDLRLLLPPSRCDTVPESPTVEVSFDYEGASGSAIVRPVDRMDQLPTIFAEDCRDSFVNRVATIVAEPKINYTVIDGRHIALLTFTATPTGKGGRLVLDDVRGTVLVSLRDPVTGIVGDTVPLALDVGSSPLPTSFTVQLVAARCDPHVVLEDKRGTFLTFTVTTAQDTGRIFLGVSDAQRVELYEFVGTVCGWS